jgi:hypothetical protein
MQTLFRTTDIANASLSLTDMSPILVKSQSVVEGFVYGRQDGKG